jgi:two-component system alkaline phosphatase synthesis response regulator PhoP/two-component system response regulator VicR
MERLIPPREAADQAGAEERARVHAEIYRRKEVSSAATVLVADDEEHVRRLLEVNLQRAGYRVVSTSDAEKVADLAREEVPAVIVLDLMMPAPHPTAHQVLTALEAHPSTCSIPVILLTGRGSPRSARREGDELLAHDLICLRKPFNPMELLTLIHRTLGDSGSYTPPPRLRD